MTRGLVRSNNLSDLGSAEQARLNLGLATVDYERIRGLFQSAGLSNVDIHRIAGSLGNYQQQIDGVTATISGLDASLYVSRSGDTVSGVWTNTGSISAVAIRVSGVVPQASSDALFVHDYQGGMFELTASGMEAPSGLTVERLIDRGGVVFASGVVTNKLAPVKIGGIQSFLEVG